MIQETLKSIYDRIQKQHEMLWDLEKYELHYTNVGKTYRLRMLRLELSAMMDELTKILNELQC